MTNADIPASSVSKNINEIIEYLYREQLGWLPGSDEPIKMLSDISYKRGITNLRFTCIFPFLTAKEGNI